MPKVSAVVSTYNSSRFIQGCLDDLIGQTLYAKGELEIIVVVSGSKENEDEVLRQYQQSHPNIIYLHTQRETMYDAWNRGIRAASGIYITNANTDDRHRSDALEVFCRALDDHPEVDAVYGDCYLSTIENETFDQNPQTRVYRYPAFFAPAQVLHYHLSPQTLWRKTLHEKIGYFDGKLKNVGDYDFNLRLALKTKAFHINDQPTGLYLAHPQALSFKDDNIRKENDALQARYRTEEMIESLYQQAGFSTAKTLERGQIHLDMGLRALQYYPPWSEGGQHAEPEFAVQCFQRALNFLPSDKAATNNLAVAYALLGDIAASLKQLTTLADSIEDATVNANIQKLEELKGKNDTPFSLEIYPSPLKIPSQQQLSSEEGAKIGYWTKSSGPKCNL